MSIINHVHKTWEKDYPSDAGHVNQVAKKEHDILCLKNHHSVARLYCLMDSFNSISGFHLLLGFSNALLVWILYPHHLTHQRVKVFKALQASRILFS